MADWRTLSSKEVYQTPWMTVRRDQVVDHNGKELTYSVVDVTSPTVFIIATNDKNEILIQREYRYTIQREQWSIPAGHSDGEDLLAAAKRELLEETGLASDDWSDMGEIFAAQGIANIPCEAFLARNARSISDERDPNEAITDQRFVSMDELEVMIRNNAIISMSTIAGIYMAKLWLRGPGWYTSDT